MASLACELGQFTSSSPHGPEMELDVPVSVDGIGAYSHAKLRIQARQRWVRQNHLAMSWSLAGVPGTLVVSCGVYNREPFGTKALKMQFAF